MNYTYISIRPQPLCLVSSGLMVMVVVVSFESVNQLWMNPTPSDSQALQFVSANNGEKQRGKIKIMKIGKREGKFNRKSLQESIR